jgi:hypothetical protein
MSGLQLTGIPRDHLEAMVIDLRARNAELLALIGNIDDAIGPHPKNETIPAAVARVAMELREARTRIEALTLVVDAYRAHDGLTLPGWFCVVCNVFNGEAKGPCGACRACNALRVVPGASP